MIKKLLLAVMVMLPSMAFAQKFGVINTEELMKSLPEMTEIQTQIEAASKKYTDELQNLQKEFQAKYEDLQKMDENSPESIKQRRVSELQELDQKIQQFRQTADQDLQRQYQQLMAPVQQKVTSAIQSVGQEGNYTMIFENVIPLYTGSDVTDITPTVKAKLGVK